jgi:predicted nucleic acid-binding Zn ribbon protein
METAATNCTECGAAMKSDQVLCSRCHRPRWYTLKKVSACLLTIALIAILIRYLVMFGDRTLSLWFG